MADASMTPPPDRPETMTAEDRDWVRGEQDFWANESRLMIDPEAALNSSRYLRILSTYTALEAVKAENARLIESVASKNRIIDGLYDAADAARSGRKEADDA